MPLQVSVDVQNAQLNQFEVIGGVSPYLRFYTGTKPATCSIAPTGTLVAEMVLPADYMSDAASGVKALSGVWQDLAANAAGDIGYCRFVKADGTTCFGQGEVTEAGGGGVIDLDNKVLKINQKIVIASFNLTSTNG